MNRTLQVILLRCAVMAIINSRLVESFRVTLPYYKNTRSPRRRLGILTDTLKSVPDSSASEEVQRLREQAAKIRQQVAELEGKTLSEVEEEAKQKKIQEEERKQTLKLEHQRVIQQKKLSNKTGNAVIYVPETIQDQKIQAANAIENAFKDGITRQTIRLALVRSDENVITPEEDLWPGGAKEMYREAAKPLTEGLLQEIRAIATHLQDENTIAGKEKHPPTIRVQDIWDFDGSALMTAEAAVGPSGDVQALVFPNTDDKYLKDIASIDKNLGKDRLFLLVNPFWKNVESWGFNILAPNAKKRAQEIIFNAEGGGFQETYVFSRFSARGEDCVAIKAYPNDWELFAYIEDYGYGYGGRPTLTTIRLGSSSEEPTSALFSKLLNERDEFKLNKTMRQLKKY